MSTTRGRSCAKVAKSRIAGKCLVGEATSAGAYALAFPGPPWWGGLALGAPVWAFDYTTLPLAGVYKPVWKYDAATLAQDLSAHLVFGAATDGALRALPA